MDKTKHTSLKFCTEKNIDNHIKKNLFKCLEELNDGIYEIEKEKKKVFLNTPIQIGIAVYYIHLGIYQQISDKRFLSDYAMRYR